MRQATPESGGHLIRVLHTVADCLYEDLSKNSPEGDEAFETRIHELILMLKRFEAEMKKGG